MPNKRNIENLSGSPFPSRKRPLIASADTENGKVFLVLSVTGEVSAIFRDKKDIGMCRVGDFAKVVAFSNLEDAKQYAKLANEEASQATNAGIESASLPRNDFNIESATDTIDFDAAVNMSDRVNSETSDGIDGREISLANLTEQPIAQVAGPSDHVTVFASSTIMKAKGQISRMSYGIYYGADSPHNLSGIAVGNISSQRADLQAAMEAIDVTFRENLVTANGHIEVCTSSKYVQTGIEKWMAKWKKSGWRNANRGPLKNGDLWEDLDGLLQEIGRDRVTVRLTTARESMESFAAGRLAESAMHKSKW